jgi:hypothetical protein
MFVTRKDTEKSLAANITTSQLTKDETNLYALHLATRANETDLASRTLATLIQDKANQADNPEYWNEKRDEDFKNWLQGVGTEADHRRTQWGRKPMIKMPGVREYLSKPIDEHYSLLKRIKRLQVKLPSDLASLREYFDFVVRTEENGYADAISKNLYHNELDRRHALLGDEMFAKVEAAVLGLNNPPMDSDFKRDYTTLTSAIDELLNIEQIEGLENRDAYRAAIGQRKQLLETLQYLPYNKQVNHAVERYYSFVGDESAKIRVKQGQLRRLREQRRNITANLAILDTFEPDILDSLRRKSVTVKLETVKSHITQLEQEVEVADSAVTVDTIENQDPQAFLQSVVQRREADAKHNLYMLLQEVHQLNLMETTDPEQLAEIASFCQHVERMCETARVNATLRNPSIHHKYVRRAAAVIPNVKTELGACVATSIECRQVTVGVDVYKRAESMLIYCLASV